MRRGRHRLRKLDECLRILEDARERGERVLSAAAMASIRSHVPALKPAMPVADAVELVYREQVRALAAEPAAVAAPAVFTSAAREATVAAAAARSISSRIREAPAKSSELLVEAHDCRVWRALGYRSWSAYVRHELALSRARSYELLAHGRLLRDIRRTVGVPVLDDVPIYAARHLRPRLAEFMADLRSQTAEVPDTDVASVVADLVDSYLPRRRGVDVGRLQAALDYLAGLPPAPAVAQDVRRANCRLTGVESALRWLGQLAQECRMTSE